jgi:thioredoxin domain-containing protein 5
MFIEPIRFFDGFSQISTLPLPRVVVVARCSHCRDLHPTWETLAEVMTAVAESLVDSRQHEYSEEEYEHAKKVELPVMVAKIDCVQHQDFCRKQNIMAYPTLRLFVDGERWKGGDYRGHRTVADMADYLSQVEDAHKTEINSSKEKNVELAHIGSWNNSRALFVLVSIRTIS